MSVDIKELFSRPDEPDEPACIEEVRRKWFSVVAAGKKPRLILITKEQMGDVEGYLEQVEIFKKAWGMKQTPNFPGLPIVHFFMGVRVEVGDSLEVLAAA